MSVVVQDELNEEFAHNNDIIQESFIDSYANLTVKSVMLLKWFTQVCDNGDRSPQYVMKTDDDMYINLAKLYEIVKTNKKPNLLTGSLICNAIPIKDPYNKWFVPNYMFSERRYPNYLSGTAYLMQKAPLQYFNTVLIIIHYAFLSCITRNFSILIGVPECCVQAVQSQLGHSSIPPGRYLHHRCLG